MMLLFRSTLQLHNNAVLAFCFEARGESRSRGWRRPPLMSVAAEPVVNGFAPRRKVFTDHNGVLPGLMNDRNRGGRNGSATSASGSL